MVCCVVYLFSLILAFCTPYEYQCYDQSCISNDLVCDGNPDCSTGEDEQYCGSGSQSGIDEHNLKFENVWSLLLSLLPLFSLFVFFFHLRMVFFFFLGGELVLFFFFCCLDPNSNETIKMFWFCFSFLFFLSFFRFFSVF